MHQDLLSDHSGRRDPPSDILNWLQFIQMSFPKVFALLGILLVASSYTEKRHVLMLTSEDLPDVTIEFPHIVINFYSAQCELCKQLTPIFNEVAKHFNASGSPLRFASVNAKEYITVSAAYEVRQYPTLILFVKRQRIRYWGERSKEALINWLNTKLLPPVAKIASDSLAELEQNGKVNIIFYGEIQTHEHGTLFQQIALADDHNHYYSVEGMQIQAGTVQILRPFAKPASTQMGKHLAAWISQHDRPYVVGFDIKTINNIFHDKNATLILFEPKQPNQALAEAFREAARKVKDQLTKHYIFTIIHHQSPYHKSFSTTINITLERSPIVLLDGNKGAKFVLCLGPTEITTEAILSFIADYEAGKLKNYEISEQVIYPKQTKGDDEL